MPKPIELHNRCSITLKPKAPYNFNANFHKPSYFPSSDNHWEDNNYWITMYWQRRRLGLKFQNMGSIDKPKIKATIYSRIKLKKDLIMTLTPEIRWRFNFDQDLTEFTHKFRQDKRLGPIIRKWKGMKPIAGNSLYENLVIYIVLQNATVRRSSQMLENLFNEYGKMVTYDNKTLSSFWPPSQIAKSSEQALRQLKVGYRAKSLHRISQQFAAKGINPYTLRTMSRDQVKRVMLTLYGIGPASIEYILYSDFYFTGAIERIPPWEQKIMSQLLFHQPLVSTQKIKDFFSKNYLGWEKLAFDYLWEDLFWRRKHQHIPWLEGEIRL